MSRYIEAPEDLKEIISSVTEDHFPELANCNIMPLMDSKKRKSKGRYIFASIKKMTECERFLSADNFVTEGYDLLLMVDGNMWENITKEDKVRIIRHELRHVLYDPESNNPYKIQDHDVQDFRKEIELNQDDPEWDYRVAEIMSAVYEKE